MPTAIVSGRVDERVRQKADAALRKAGLTPTDVIQSVWNEIARSGDVPDIARPKREAEESVALERLEQFLEQLPPVNPAYAGFSDDEILALRVQDHA